MSPFRSKIKEIRSGLAAHFLSGLLILAPILIVLVVFHWIFGGLVDWIENVPLKFIFSQEADTELLGIFRFLIVIGTLVGGILFIALIGFFSRLYIGNKVLTAMKQALEKIPVFGSVYSSLNQLLKAVSNQGGEKQFNRVVFVEYPRKDVWSVAFVTGKANFKGLPPGLISIFIPAVPVPTSGFHLMVKESEVIESGLKVDEAFTLILSLGTAAPRE